MSVRSVLGEAASNTGFKPLAPQGIRLDKLSWNWYEMDRKVAGFIVKVVLIFERKSIFCRNTRIGVLGVAASWLLAVAILGFWTIAGSNDSGKGCFLSYLAG